MPTLPKLSVPLSLETATFVAETRRVEGAVRSMGAGIDRQNALITRGFSGVTRGVGLLRNALAGLGVGIASAGLTSLVKGSLDALDALAKTSRQLGVTVEQLQAYQRGADLAGVGTEGLERNLQIFVRRLGEADRGTGELRKVLAENNIELRDASGGFRSTNDLLAEFADLIANAGSAQEKAALANAAFGRSGAAMVEFLADGSAGLRGMVTELERSTHATQEQAEAAERANDAITRWSTAISTHLTVAIGDALIGIEQLVVAFQQLSTLNVDTKIAQINAQIATLRQEMAEVPFDFLRDDYEATIQRLERERERLMAERQKFLDAGLALPPPVAPPRPSPFSPPPDLGGGGGGGGLGGLTGPLIGPAPMSRTAAQSFGLDVISTHGAGTPADFAGSLEALRAMSQEQAKLNAEVAKTPPAVEQVNIAYDLALDTARQFAQITASGFTEAIFAGQGLTDTLEQIGLSLAKAVTEAIIFNSLMAAIGGAGFAGGGGGASGGLFGAIAGLFGGGKAGGGSVSAGRLYTVGERGTELFAPGRSGTIIPNSALAALGGGGGPNYIINDMRGRDAPPIETNVDARGMVSMTIRSELTAMARDGSLSRLTGTSRKGIARG